MRVKKIGELKINQIPKFKYMGIFFFDGGTVLKNKQTEGIRTHIAKVKVLRNGKKSQETNK